MKKEKNKNPIQPVSGTKVPRFAGPSTFARLPELRETLAGKAVFRSMDGRAIRNAGTGTRTSAAQNLRVSR